MAVTLKDLIPAKFRNIAAWSDLADVYEESLINDIRDSLLRLKRIRDVDLVDEDMLGKFKNLLGLYIDTSSFTTAQLRRMLETLSYFYEKSGTNVTMDLIGYAKNTQVDIIPLYANRRIYDELLGSGDGLTNFTGSLDNLPLQQYWYDCASFNGLNQNAVGATSVDLPTGESITVLAWVMPVGTQSDSTLNGIVGWGGRTTDNDSFIVGINNAGKISVSTFGDSVIQNTGASIPNNAWTLIGVTLDAITVKMYINGELVDTEQILSPGPIILSTDLVIGSSDISGRFFSGLIDGIRIFNKVLSDTDMTRAYQSLDYVELPNDPNLLAKFDFNDQTGTTLTDTSVKGNDCTLDSSNQWVRGGLVISDDFEHFYDNGSGVLRGTRGGTGTINYTSGAFSVTFNTGVLTGETVSASYNTRKYNTFYNQADIGILTSNRGDWYLTNHVELAADFNDVSPSELTTIFYQLAPVPLVAQVSIALQDTATIQDEVEFFEVDSGAINIEPINNNAING